MVDLVVSNNITIQSYKGKYSVSFDNQLFLKFNQLLENQSHFLVDSKVASLYENQLQSILNCPLTIIIDSTEENKSIEHIIPIIEKLVTNKIRRNQSLIAIGGGIIQDITCFITSILLRGLPWKFIPTTLLAQADSCIGSKSSINLGRIKNILGTFNPPNEILICTDFLNTLEDKDIRSGLGEILKVHAINSASSYDRLSNDYDKLWKDRNLLLTYIREALLIKQRYIEVDEFDQGIRNIFNYGHSFGHAIESAANFEIPHGIAVAMGMDMANYISVMLGVLPEYHYHRMKPSLYKNYHHYKATPIPVDSMLSALMKDKKNTLSKLVLILPVGNDSQVQRVEVLPNDDFKKHCQEFIEKMKNEKY